MARGGNSVVVIKWRDIPAQVNAQMGRDRYQVVLSAKFQRAIDRAKRKANIYTAEEDIAQWSRDTLPLEGTLAEAAQKVADEIEAKYSRQHLGVLAYAGGFEKDIEQLTVAAKDLAALEELEEEISYLELTSIKWNFEKKDGHWHIYYSNDYTTDSLSAIRSFYKAGIGSDKRFLEENWVNKNEAENLSELFYHIELVHEVASVETETLVRSEIQPKLTKLFSEENSPYEYFCQRISQQTTANWDEQYTEKFIFKDVLISNPEKTAFIFPVILNVKGDQNDLEYYSPNEEFKFYVLLKNTDGSYRMYDWYYFKPLSYWSNYSLLRCAETHLKHISNFTEDQEIINDPKFWDNYIFKRGNRGFEYLMPVVMSNESIVISKSEFDAQVQDCIDILSEYDVVDLYEHQLKQIIRCINTIQKGSLSGAQNLKLITLSQELHFQKRLNKIQKADGNYYPALNVELGIPFKESSYYQIR